MDGHRWLNGEEDGSSHGSGVAHDGWPECVVVSRVCDFGIRLKMMRWQHLIG